MSRYIDTDDFKKLIKPYDTDDIIDRALYNFAHNKMMNTPTADVRENVHATFVSKIIKKADWKGQMQSYYQPNSCSNCDVALTGEENFCPNCGADMRKRKGEKMLKRTIKADVVEIKKEGEWEMFDLISSAYYGKGMYFKQDDGIVYSRYSCKYMSVDEAIREFVSLIDDSDLPNFGGLVERKAGKWVEQKVIEDGKAIEEWQSAKCSVCGKYHTTPYLYNFDDFNYCPNCGAMMKERREDGGKTD